MCAASTEAPEAPQRLVLFYQYVTPAWSEDERERMRAWLETLCRGLECNGRLRVAQDGLNGNLSGTPAAIAAFERCLQSAEGESANPFAAQFTETDFKEAPCTGAEAFNALKVWSAAEVVNVGLSVTDVEPA